MVIIMVVALFFRSYQLMPLNEGLILASLLSIMGLYILARRIYGWQIAGITAFLMAISHWHTAITRQGSQEVWLILLITFIFYFIWEGLRSNHISDFMWAGALTAIGLYTFMNFSYVVPILIIIFLSYWAYLKADFEHSKYDHSRHILLKNFTALFLTGLILTLPLIFSSWLNISGLIDSYGATTIFSGSNILDSFYANFSDTFSSFWFDSRSLLSWPIGIFFAFGLINELAHLFRRKHGHLSTIHIFMISWLFVLLIPNFISHNSLPTMVLPAVMIFSARGVWWLIDNLSKWQHMASGSPTSQSLHINAQLVLVALLFSFTVVEYYWLFGPLFS